MGLLLDLILSSTSNAIMDRQQIDLFLISLLEDMISEWGLDLPSPIGPTTELIADLGFSSIDFIHLITSIEEHYNRPKLPFDRLFMVNGEYIRALTLAQLADFIHQHLSIKS